MDRLNREVKITEFGGEKKKLEEWMFPVPKVFYIGCVQLSGIFI